MKTRDSPTIWSADRSVQVDAIFLSAGAWIPGEDTKCSWEDEDGVLFYSTEKIKAGDELFHHYIDSSAIRLLSYYGFTEKGNISPMQFTIPEIRLGKFKDVK